MSFDSHSELPSHLLALAHLTQWHSETHQQPLDLRFTVHGTTVETVTTAITGNLGTAAPADFTHSATVAVYELATAGHFDGSYQVRINTSPGGQAIVKQMPIAAPASETEEAPAAPSEPETAVSNNGLQLRSALIARGHTSGYSPDEIAAEEKQRGFTFTPELKFYRALVRNGVVAEVDGKNVIASTPQADFGASTLDSAPWKAPEKTDGTVQAILNHPLWIEIANSPTHLYAIDLAPGARGTAGQVIARRIGEASVPVQVALTLAAFVTGEFVGQDAPAQAPLAAQQAPAAQDSGRLALAQTIAWVGTVEPLALPGFLGWTLAPNENRYRAVLALISPESAELAPEPQAPGQAPAAPAEPAHPLTGAQQEVRPAPAAPVVIKSTTTSENASSLFTSSGEEAPEEALADDTQAASLLVSDDPTVAVAGQPEQADEAEAPKQDIRDIDPGVAKVPASPEQKNIASTIEALAFGEGEAPNASAPAESPQGTPAETPEAAPAEEPKPESTQQEKPQQAEQKKQEEGGIRSALRKFFIG
ncbi:hypothetical protein [Rothia nasimurium]|uniref:hypothetical protein n=2 Tax=Rothia nasimurium TaxID=85336 RepID=UPI001F47D919|nr:hypothetical protein [Rothia nasimurium]